MLSLKETPSACPSLCGPPPKLPKLQTVIVGLRFLEIKQGLNYG